MRDGNQDAGLQKSLSSMWQNIQTDQAKPVWLQYSILHNTVGTFSFTPGATSITHAPAKNNLMCKLGGVYGFIKIDLSADICNQINCAGTRVSEELSWALLQLQLNSVWY